MLSRTQQGVNDVVDTRSGNQAFLQLGGRFREIAAVIKFRSVAVISTRAS